MKKLYSNKENKEYYKRRLLKIERKKRKKNKIHTQEKKRRRRSLKMINDYHKNKHNYEFPLFAPKDFRLMDNTEICLDFFRELRSHENVNMLGGQKRVLISLVDVEQIDYATISALTAISDDLKSRKIGLQGDFPLNSTCKKYIIESGFLSHMVDGSNRQFPKTDKSTFIFFEKGSGILTKKDSKNISELIKDVVEHLTGTRRIIKPIKSILLEICGNSIEHAKTKDRQWLLGVKYVDKRVFFTVTDVGKGILETLFIKNAQALVNFTGINSRLDILKGAFNRKYGSSTQEENRNKGLPAVKYNSEIGAIKNLIVLTNNVILHFENDDKSSIFSLGTARFKGTMYQWELTEECITNTINYYGEN
ncbi:hypothetical protein B4N84_09440 [Flavobacterium sp. IR1]|nr:hypothetical protein B4N84_09440 [Flavobacterium sp. IR1]